MTAADHTRAPRSTSPGRPAALHPALVARYAHAAHQALANATRRTLTSAKEAANAAETAVGTRQAALEHLAHPDPRPAGAAASSHSTEADR